MLIDVLSRIVLTGDHTLETAISKLSRIFINLELHDFADETMVSFSTRKN